MFLPRLDKEVLEVLPRLDSGYQCLTLFLCVLVHSRCNDGGFRLFGRLEYAVLITVSTSKPLDLCNLFEEDMNWLSGIKWCLYAIFVDVKFARGDMTVGLVQPREDVRCGLSSKYTLTKHYAPYANRFDGSNKDGFQCRIHVFVLDINIFLRA